MTSPTTWRKSSYSFNSGNCVEIAATGTAVRDSKHPDGGYVVTGPAELGALVDACRAGRLDHLTT